MAKKIFKVIPYDSASGQMSYDLVSFAANEPEHVAKFEDLELANHTATFIEAFLKDEGFVPALMTTVEFYDQLVSLNVYEKTGVRSTQYYRVRRLGLTPIKKVGRTSYYSKRQLVQVVRNVFPSVYEEMVSSIERFGRMYSLLKRSL
jgi:hypothetical protein